MAGRFTVGGVVIGLTGTGLVLTNNGVDNLAVSANGSFTFNAVYPVGSGYNVVVGTQPAGQNCTVAQGNGYLTNVNYGSAVVSCAAVTGKATRTVSTLNAAAQALADKLSGRTLYLTCLDAQSPDTIHGFVLDEMSGLVTPLSGAIYGFPIDAALSKPMQCGAHSVATDGAWIYVRNTATQIVSVYSAGYGPIGSMVTTTR